MVEMFEKELAKSDPRDPPEIQGLGLVGQGIASNYGSRDEQVYALVVGYKHQDNMEYGVHKLYIPYNRTTMHVRIEAGAYRLVNIQSFPEWKDSSVIHGQRIYLNNMNTMNEMDVQETNGNGNGNINININSNMYREAYIVDYEMKWKWTVYDPQDDTLTVYDLGRMRKKWEFLDIGVWEINGITLSTWSTPPNV